jgi:hypothetical protein
MNFEDHDSFDDALAALDDAPLGAPESIEVSYEAVINNLQQGWMSQVANLQYVNAQLAAKVQEVDRRLLESNARCGALEGALLTESETNRAGIAALEERLDQALKGAEEALASLSSPVDDPPQEDVFQAAAALAGQPVLASSSAPEES